VKLVLVTGAGNNYTILSLQLLFNLLLTYCQRIIP